MRPYDDPPDIDEDSLSVDAEDAALAERRAPGYGGGRARGGINLAAFELLRHSSVPLVASMYSGSGGQGPGARARRTPFEEYPVRALDHGLAGQGADPSIGETAVAVKHDAYRMWATNPDDFPEIVAVGDNDGYWASGICIEEGYVLTAGHVHALGGRKRVFAKNSLTPTETCRKDTYRSRLRSGEYKVEDDIRHAGFWNEPFFTHDLALLKLKPKGGKLPQKVAEIATYAEFKKAAVGLLVGFGGNNPSDYGTRRHGLIPILHEWMIARERWFHRVWGYDSDYEFIATAPLKKADACAGDSGAGFYIPICPNCTTEEGVGCCRCVPVLFEVKMRGKKVKKWYCDCEHGYIATGKKKIEYPEVKWKLAGMVSRQFGLGGDRCGAGSIYVKLYGNRRNAKGAPLAETSKQKTAAKSLLQSSKSAEHEHDGDSEEDRGADFYGGCITEMMSSLEVAKKERSSKRRVDDSATCDPKRDTKSGELVDEPEVQKSVE